MPIFHAETALELYCISYSMKTHNLIFFDVNYNQSMYMQTVTLGYVKLCMLICMKCFIKLAFICIYSFQEKVHI